MTGLVLLAAVGVLAWTVTVAWLPYGPCGRCKNRRGRGAGSTGKAWNRCRKCGGKGERARVGARTVRKMIGRPL